MMGLFGYVGASLGEFLTGFMIDKTTTIVDDEKIYDFASLSYFWIGADFMSVIAATIFAIMIYLKE
ncbi:hypothetical protein RDJ12_08660 [Mergibacter septicus]|nr:hypothetical protein [Mergibacter septicus]UTU48414.1 hypothetical protein HLL31_06340 [Mergibacter septicus]WMR96887.1 hypothetical protein RDJ12_08660 [Mergibacter septicus]